MILTSHLGTSEVWTLRSFLRSGDWGKAKAYLRSKPPFSGSWREGDLHASLTHLDSLNKEEA